MTDEERQNLCAGLRRIHSGYYQLNGNYREIGIAAADEIERLEKELETYRHMYLKWKKQAISYSQVQMKALAILLSLSTPTLAEIKCAGAVYPTVCVQVGER